jgi:hypothetical protein
MVNGDGEPIEVPVEEPVEVSEGIPLKRRAGRPPGSRNSSSMISYALSITQIPLNSATKNGKDLQLKSAEMTSPSRPTGRNKRSAGPLASSTPKRKGRPAGVKDNTPRFRSTSKLIFPDVDFSSVLSEREGAAISGSHRNKRVTSFMMRQKSGQKKKLEMARDPAGNGTRVSSWWLIKFSEAKLIFWWKKQEPRAIFGKSFNSSGSGTKMLNMYSILWWELNQRLAFRSQSINQSINQPF